MLKHSRRVMVMRRRQVSDVCTRTSTAPYNSLRISASQRLIDSTACAHSDQNGYRSKYWKPLHPSPFLCDTTLPKSEASRKHNERKPTSPDFRPKQNGFLIQEGSLTCALYKIQKNCTLNVPPANIFRNLDLKKKILGGKDPKNTP